MPDLPLLVKKGSKNSFELVEPLPNITQKFKSSKMNTSSEFQKKNLLTRVPTNYSNNSFEEQKHVPKRLFNSSLSQRSSDLEGSLLSSVFSNSDDKIAEEEPFNVSAAHAKYELKSRVHELFDRFRIVVRTLIHARRMEKAKVLEKLSKISQSFVHDHPAKQEKTQKQQQPKQDQQTPLPEREDQFYVEKIKLATDRTGVALHLLEAPKLSVKVERPQFRLEDYTATKRKTLVTSFLIEKVLSKPAEERTDVDLQSVDRLLLNIPYFQVFSRFPKVRREIGRAFEYRCFEKGRDIVRQGHPCSYIYVILKGYVAYRHVAAEGNSHGKKENERNLKEADPFRKEEFEKTMHGKQMGLNESQIYNIGLGLKDGSWFKTLRQGQVFGDIEIREKTNRAATATVASDMVELLAMTKEDFERIILAFQEQLDGENYRILKQIPILSSIPDDDLMAISHSCLLKEFPANSIVLRQNELHPECLYYVISGSVKYSRAIPVKKKLQKDLYSKSISHFNHGYELTHFNYNVADGSGSKADAAIRKALIRRSSVIKEEEEEDEEQEGEEDKTSPRAIFNQISNRQRAILVDTGMANAGDLFGDESFFLYSKQMSRKTCLREHFRYPLISSTLPDRMDIMFHNAVRSKDTGNRDEAGVSARARKKSLQIQIAARRKSSLLLPPLKPGINRRISATAAQVAQLLRRKSLAQMNMPSVLSATQALLPSHEKARVKDPKHIFRRVLFNVTTNAVTTCLLIPKLKLLRYIGEEHFDGLRKKSRSLLILGVMQEYENRTGQKSTISSDISLNNLSSRTGGAIPSSNQNIKSATETIIDNVNVWTVKDPDSNGLDVLEAAIDRTIWSHYLRNWEWERFKAESIRKARAERESTKAMMRAQNITQRYASQK